MESSSSKDLDVDSRLHRQEVVADLATRALSADDLDRVLDAVTEAVAETLGGAYCGAFEVRPEGTEATLRAGVGWRSGAVGDVTVDAGDGSLAGETLERDGAVVVDDLATDERVTDAASGLLEEHDVAACVAVRVGPADDPWGALAAHATEPGAFAEADGDFLQRVGDVVGAAVENATPRAGPVEAEATEVYGRISDAFFALDEEWRFTYLNERARELINPESRTLVGQNVWDEFPAAVGRQFKAEYERAMYKQETVSFEEYYPEPLDAWFEVRAYPSETGLSVYFRDVTERKEREQELKRFEVLFEESTDVNAVLNPDGSYQYVPPSSKKVLGYDPEELEGEVAFDYIHPEDREAVISEFERLLEDPDREPKQKFRYRHADGSWIWLEAVGRNLLGNPQIEGVVVYTRDVTERRAKERRLEESEQRYRTLAERFPNGVVTLFDEDLRYSLAAGQAFEYLPVSSDDVEGNTVGEAWGEDVAAELEPLLADAIEGESGSAEVSYVGRDWLIYAVPIADAEGDVFSGMTMAQDVTERKEYERRLEESERRYRTLAEHFPNGAVGVYDGDLRYTLTEGTKLGEDLPGADELEGNRMPEIFPEHTVSDLEPTFRGAVEDGETGSTTTQFGGRYWRVWAAPLRNKDGEIFAGLSLTQDVTGRIEREQRLERHETIVETVDDGVYVVDEDGYFTMVNEAFAEMLGYPREEFVGMHISTVADADALEEANELQTALEEGRVDEASMVAELRTASGETFPAEATFALLPEDDDEWHRVGVVRDISDQKERERKLAESERRYRTLVENFPDGAVAMFDEQMEYSVAGGRLLDQVGVDAAERVGNSVYDIYPDDIVGQVEPYFDAVFEGEANSFEVGFHDRQLFAHTLPVRNAAGEIFAGMLVVQDVTERREYERRLEESNERLEQFAYAASHDLQEPLRMVSSYLQLVESRYADALDEEGREFIEFAVDGAERMREMIDALLEYSRVETRGDPFEPVDLEEVLEDVREDLQMKIDERDAEVTTEPLPTVEGDRGQLRQVVQNLLDNALEYSGDEPPRVHVAAERRDGDWLLSVEDEGIGIDPDDAETVFEVFQRLHSREEYEGTGIGLALCERIVERHGGGIWVESEPGEGSTFYFTLPGGETDA